MLLNLLRHTGQPSSHPTLPQQGTVSSTRSTVPNLRNLVLCYMTVQRTSNHSETTPIKKKKILTRLFNMQNSQLSYCYFFFSNDLVYKVVSMAKSHPLSSSLSECILLLGIYANGFIT